MPCHLVWVPNELADGQTRFGFIFDGLEDTPNIPVQVTRSETSIEMVLPWLDSYNPDHERWFVGNTMWGDDPARTKYRYDVPSEIAFIDPSGPMALIGCSASGHQRNFGYGVGAGRATVDFAVLGAHDAGAFKSIHGLRSEVEGLGTWVNLRSLTQDRELDEEGRLATAHLKLDSPPSIRIGTSPRTEIRPAYSYGPGEHPDETVIRERMLVQTLSRTEADWWSHLDRHLAIRDLVRLATWQRLNFISHDATRNDDPIRTLDGKGHGRAWRPVSTTRTGQTATTFTVRAFDYLFHFNDVSRAGLTRWLNFHQGEPRIVQPVLRLLELEGASLETHLAQLGMGLEALGYFEALESGVSKTKARNEKVGDRLVRVVDRLASTLPFDRNAAAADVAKVYNSVKHANRTMPSTNEMLLGYYKGVQIFRGWAMDLLGIRLSVASKLMEHDQVTRRISNLEPA